MTWLLKVSIILVSGITIDYERPVSDDFVCNVAGAIVITELKFREDVRDVSYSCQEIK